MTATQATREEGVRLGRVIARATTNKCTTNSAVVKSRLSDWCSQFNANAMAGLYGHLPCGKRVLEVLTRRIATAAYIQPTLAVRAETPPLASVVNHGALAAGFA